MTVYLAFHPGDVSLAKGLLSWMNDLQSPRSHSLVLAADPATDFLECCLCRTIAQAPGSPFQTVEIIVAPKIVNGWIAGSNMLWLLAAQHAELAKVPYWLFIEPDAVPIRRSWLDDIEAAHKRMACRYSGALVRHDNPKHPSPYLEGCAVYPGTAWTELQGLVATQQSWTLATAPVVVRQALNSPVFQHLWGEAGKPPTFAQQAVPGTEVFGLDYIRPETALFHRNKDGTLIKLLRQRLGIAAPQARQRIRYRSTQQIVTLRRTGAIGDVLCASPIAERLLQQGYGVRYESHLDTHCLMRRHRTEIAMVQPGQGTGIRIDLDGAYEKDPRRRFRHFHEMFFETANRQLARHGIEVGSPLNCTPRIIVEPNDTNWMLSPYPRPWVFICPQSNNFPNRTVPARVWGAAAPMIRGTCFWLGMNRSPSGVIDLQVRHLDTLIRLLAQADLLLTVDTGPLHIGAALNVPSVVINQSSFAEHHLSDQNDFVTIAPALGCLDCQAATCPHGGIPACQNVPPELIAEAANRRLEGGVSAVVAVYKPGLDRLNRCLDAVLPLVKEVVVCRDTAGLFPGGARTGPKIRYLVCPKQDIGYGLKVNYAARHASGEWLWMLNDDCFVEPTTLTRMQEVIRPGVGMVAHELRYPNGLLQHGGTYRNPGDIGWGHLDHNSVESRIKQPVEMENVTGASVLIRRKAFYQADAFDEEFYLYCEDNAMCLQLRRAGWTIVYTPHAKAIHDEHSSTKLTPNLHQIMVGSQAVLKRKWGDYFTHNRNRVPGNFDYGLL